MINSKQAREKFKTIGTKENPVRCSKVKTLLQCERWFVMDVLKLRDNPSGEAAQNGTVAAGAVEDWHKLGGDIGKAMTSAQARLGKDNPLADWVLAHTVLTKYDADKRNAPGELIPEDPTWGKVHNDSIEMPVEFEVEGIWYRGKIDYVREPEPGVLCVWDEKLSRMWTGQKIVNDHAAQISLYTVGLREMLGDPTIDVRPGGIVRLTDYTLKTQGQVFHPARWTYEQAMLYVKNISRRIKLLREKKFTLEIGVSTGYYCDWCLGGIEVCTEHIVRHLGSAYSQDATEDDRVF